MAEAEGGALVIKTDPLDLSQLLAELIETLAPVAESFGIPLQAEVSSGLSLIGDSGRLFQALSNHLDNAIKYSGPGGQIRLHGGPDADGCGLVITVEDSGCGIAEDDLPHVFERYYRGRTARERRGSGLGLPLVRAIVQAHGGWITVASKPGRGTSFHLFFPADTTGAAATPMNDVTS